MPTKKVTFDSHIADWSILSQEWKTKFNLRSDPAEGQGERRIIDKFGIISWINETSGKQ